MSLLVYKHSVVRSIRMLKRLGRKIESVQKEKTQKLERGDHVCSN